MRVSLKEKKGEKESESLRVNSYVCGVRAWVSSKEKKRESKRLNIPV